MTLELDLASPLLHAEDLFYLWPSKLAVQARAQADKHLLGGVIRDATLSLALEARPQGEPWVMERFHHHAHLEAARVLTHVPLGPLSDVSGHLEIDGRVLRVDVSEARLENLLLKRWTGQHQLRVSGRNPDRDAVRLPGRSRGGVDPPD